MCGYIIFGFLALVVLGMLAATGVFTKMFNVIKNKKNKFTDL